MDMAGTLYIAYFEVSEHHIPTHLSFFLDPSLNVTP